MHEQLNANVYTVGTHFSIYPTEVKSETFSTKLNNVEKEKWSKKNVNSEQKCQYGFVDKTGNFVILVKYVSIGPFSEGLAPVQVCHLIAKP